MEAGMCCGDRPQWPLRSQRKRKRIFSRIEYSIKFVVLIFAGVADPAHDKDDEDV